MTVSQVFDTDLCYFWPVWVLRMVGFSEKVGIESLRVGFQNLTVWV